MKILRPFTGTGSVFWPIGPLPHGTCEFATEACRKHCYAALASYPNFDEELRVPDADKRAIYKSFIAYPLGWLRDEIVRELDGLQTNILHWFGSGDCPTKDVPRVLEIIVAVDEMKGITQIGFTRNHQLWEARKDVFALTVESETEIAGRKGLFSVTDYEAGTSQMFWGASPTRGGQCGPVMCSDGADDTLDHFINCQACQRLHTGCFDREPAEEIPSADD